VTRMLYGILAKDLKLILRNKQIWLPMTILPAVMTMLVPGMFMYGITHSPRQLDDVRNLMRFIPSGLTFDTDVQRAYYAGLNYMFPPLFLMIPLIASSVIGAGCLVAEKESKTLETLLYAPITLTELLYAKLVATFVPAYAITLVSFGLFVTVVHLTAPPDARVVGFPVARWLTLILTVCPAMILVGLSAMVMVSAYATTFQGAQQLSSFVVVPITFALIAQMSGAYAMETGTLLGAAVGLTGLAALLLRLAASRLTYERLLEH
jgi:ABC-type Na+ efflux pump permease subunit